MSDLLSSFLTGELAETYINKIYRLMNVVVVLALVWTAISLLNLYAYIDNTPAVSKLHNAFYVYKLLPAISVANLAMNLAWVLLLRQAWGNWKTYLETSDDHQLHKGLKNFYAAAVLVVAWFLVSIANTSYETFFR